MAPAWIPTADPSAEASDSMNTQTRVTAGDGRGIDPNGG
jgi:hypothetical protein